MVSSIKAKQAVPRLQAYKKKKKEEYAKNKHRIVVKMGEIK